MNQLKYTSVFPGKTVLVFVPYEDDEINVAGALIAGLCQEGFRVICAFATNGDRSYLGETRISEALRALKVLGVSEENAIFLGYPDGGLYAERCVLMHGRDRAVEAEGKTETYGMKGKPDFCMSIHGFHRAYTWEGFCEDIRDLLLYYRPESIVGVDFDFHPDHRMCSIALEQVLGELLNREENDWHPRVLKAFAYNTGFESVKDFYEDNLYSTVFNRDGIMNPSWETDNPIYEWEKRLRLPVPEECRVPLLKGNRIFQAAQCHLSQKAMLQAVRIINGDEVFWVRRTDNLLFRGNVTVSSGEGKYLHDFQMISAKDVRPRHSVVMEDCLWTPERSDPAPFCRCDFPVPQHIEAASFYGNPGNTGRILKGKLVFSTGYECEIPPMNAWGQEVAANFPPQDGVEWIEYRIEEMEGDNPGLSEWEVFEQKELPCRMLHILADGNFAYDWFVPSGKPGPEISAYTYGVKESVQWMWDGKRCTLEEIRKHCVHITKVHIIRAEAGDLEDEIRLIPVSFLWKLKRAFSILADKLYLWIEKQRIKPEHHRLHMLKKRQRKMNARKN